MALDTLSAYTRTSGVLPHKFKERLMKTAGVVFDFYDDLQGSILKKTFPDVESLPTLIKEAHILSPEERDVLRDDAYALTMVNNGKVLRKFACVDPGNTLLSALYFAHSMDLLPEEAQKVAAENIDAACQEFGLEVPFVKEAISTTMLTPKGKPSMLAKALKNATPSRAMEFAGKMQEKGTNKLLAGAKKIPAALAAGSTAEQHVMEGLAKGASAKGASRQRDSMRQPIVGDEADWAQRTNLVSVRGGSDSGRVIPTANQMKTAAAKKEKSKAVKRIGVGAGLGAGVGLAGAGAGHLVARALERGLDGGNARVPGRILARYYGKGALAGAIPGAAIGALTHHAISKEKKAFSTTPEGHKLDAKTYGSLSKAHSIARQDINKARQEYGKKAPVRSWLLHGRMSDNNDDLDTSDLRLSERHFDYAAKKHEKGENAYNPFGGWLTPSRHERKEKRSGVVDVSGQEPETIFVKKTASINALGKYPLDSYADVRAAVGYFNDNWNQFSPEDRREFCKVASARAQDIGIEVPDLMARYGSSSYAPDVEAHLASRKAAAPAYAEVYEVMLEKMAEIEPEHFAELLKQADVAAELNWHWGSWIADPWFSTFGGVGQEKVAFAWESHDGKSVDEQSLQELAASGALSSAFDKDFVASFAKDPVSIFESMPDDAKRIIADIAGDKQKVSGAMSHAVEIAGLGILGKPSADRLRGKHVDEKGAAKKEIAGLGVLAAPSAAHLGSDAMKKVAPKLHARAAASKVGQFLAKHGSVEKTGGGFDRYAALRRAATKAVPAVLPKP